MRRITDENIRKFKHELSKVSREIVLGSDNTENAYNTFIIKFKALYDACSDVREETSECCLRKPRIQSVPVKFVF